MYHMPTYPVRSKRQVLKSILMSYLFDRWVDGTALVITGKESIWRGALLVSFLQVFVSIIAQFLIILKMKNYNFS